MTALLIGILSGILLIITFIVLKQFDKKLIYGLILAGIGFLYVGFTWTDLASLVICCIQAVAFLIMAYYGIKKSMTILAVGFFLHGCWDIIYSFFDNPRLIPPYYEIFCFTIDFVIGIYLLMLGRKSGELNRYSKS